MARVVVAWLIFASCLVVGVALSTCVMTAHADHQSGGPRILQDLLNTFKTSSEAARLIRGRCWQGLMTHARHVQPILYSLTDISDL